MSAKEKVCLSAEPGIPDVILSSIHYVASVVASSDRNRTRSRTP